MNNGFDINYANFLFSSEKYDEAYDYITPFASDGVSSAQLMMAKGFCEGLGKPQSPKAAIRWFEKIINNPVATDDEKATSYYNIGIGYHFGNGVEQNTDEAFDYFSLSADLKFPWAYYALYTYYYTGTKVVQNYETAFDLCKKAALNDVPEAFLALGNLYRLGKGVEQNYSEAINWFKKAEKANLPEAFHDLGNMYFNGLGTKKDYDLAYEYYQKAADRNIPNAYYALGICYSNGFSVEKNLLKSFNCYLKAADEGVPEAIHNAATFYFDGDVVEKDINKAFEYLEKSYQCGIEESLILLARCCIELKNYTQAKELFEKATKSENPTIRSQGNCGLALIYLEGLGVEKNLNRAAKYFSKDTSEYKEQNMFLLMRHDCERAWEWAEDETEKGNLSVAAYSALFYLLGIGTETNRQKAIEIVSAENAQSDPFSLLILSHCYEMGYTECGVDVAESARLQTLAVELDIDEANKSQKGIVDEIIYKQKSEEEKLEELQARIAELQEKLSENCFPVNTILSAVESLKRKVDNLDTKFESFIKNFKDESNSLVQKIESLQKQLETADEKLSEWFEAEAELSEKFRTFTENNLKNNVSGEEIKENLQNLFGENWDMLDEYTQAVLVTGQYTFNNLESSALPDPDYSGVCIYICSALEHHLKQILFVGLQNYLEKHQVKPIADWPNALKFEDRATGETKRNDGRSSFTLGGISYYLGAKENKRSETLYNGLNELLEQYAKSATGNPDFSIEKNMNPVINRIEKVTVTYRNPAAHTEKVDHNHAFDCLNEIVGKKEAAQTLDTVKGLLLEITTMFSNYKSA